MAGKKGGENTKKAAGNAKKAEAAATKQAAQDRKAEAAESEKWGKGAKDNSKAEAAAAKAAEAARKKAEKEALMKEEEASLPSKGPSKTKTAQKKTASRGLDLGQLEGDSARPGAGSRKGTDLNASGIDNALDALSLTANKQEQIDRHPERRFKAAYAAYEEKRLEEMKDDKGLRRNQKIEQIRKEFEKHPDNPFNQVSAKFDSTKEEMAEIREKERQKLESRLGS